jgi:peptidoglycan L-alanyl-D-glutamate endopeptidase CwlK
MSRSLEDLHPTVKEMALMLQKLALEKGIKIIFTQTSRTEAEQIALYAHGRKSLDKVNALREKAGMPKITAAENTWRTNAKTILNSYHGYGLAFDIAIVSPDGKTIEWDVKKTDWNKDGISDWLQVGKLSNDVPGLEWGGYWSSSPDIPHYQYTFGLTIKDLIDGKKPA